MMDSKENKICRLCLNTCDGKFEIIQGVDKKMLEILLVDMDFDINDGCVKCKKCTEMLQKCFEFKSICLHTEDKLMVFIESRNLNRASMTEVYLEHMQNQEMDHFDTTETCRFCMKPTTTHSDLNESDEYFRDMLEKFLPEVTLYFTSNPVGCSSCLSNLKSYFTFLKCLHLVEEHIKAYHETKCEIKSRKVELNNVVQSVLKNILTEKIFNEEQLIEVYFAGLITKNCNKNESTIRNVPLEKTMEEIYKSENYCLENSKKENCIQNYIKPEEIEIKTDGTIESDDDSTLSISSVQQETTVANISHSDGGKTIMVSESEEEHRIEENPKQLQCSHCRYRTYNEDCLKKHQVIHGDNAKYECPQCQKVFKSKTNLDFHLLGKHDNLCDLITSKIYFCDTCDYKTLKTSDLVFHKNAKHSRLKNFRCNYCSRAFLWKRSLQRHISSIHLKLRPHFCKHCKKTFTQKQYLDEHIVLFHEKNVDLMRMVTSKIHKCPQCQKVFESKRNLDCHLLANHDNLCDLITSKIYFCDTCDYKTIKTSDLVFHINAKHSQLENFRCNYCSRVFLWKRSLQRHISSIHLKLRPHMCKGCKKTFTQKHYLDEHIVLFHQKNVGLMRTVTSKIHKCDHCSYKCIFQKKMTIHMKTHHKF